MHHVLFILVCIIWGSSFLLMRIGLESFGPIGVAAVRVASGAAALALIWFGLRQPWPMSRRDLVPLLALTVIGYVVPFWIQPYIIGVIDVHTGHGSSFTGMMVALVPMMTIVVSVPMLGVRPQRRQVIGVVGGLGGMIYLFSGELRGGVAMLDLLLASVTPLCYALSNTYVKRRFAAVPVSALVLSTLTLSSVLLLPLMLLEPLPAATDPRLPAALGSLLALGVAATGIATFLFYRLVQSHGPLYAGMVTYIIPCVALLLGWFWGEPITTTQVVSLAVIFVMVALVQSGQPQAPVAPRPPE